MNQHIIEAAKLIAYDNGAINRLHTEESVVKHMLDSLDVYTSEELRDVENFLAHLSKEDLEELCTGEYGAVPATKLVEAVLEKMFDNM